jgi:hypothetical protein
VAKGFCTVLAGLALFLAVFSASSPSPGAKTPVHLLSSASSAVPDLLAGALACEEKIAPLGFDNMIPPLLLMAPPIPKYGPLAATARLLVNVLAATVRCPPA